LRKVSTTWAQGIGEVRCRTESSGGQFLKRPRSIKDCNARRRNFEFGD